MLKKAKMWLLGLLAVTLTVPACGGASFSFKDVELNQIEAMYNNEDGEESLGLYFISSEELKETPYAYAYAYIIPEKELSVTSYDLDAEKSGHTTFFTVFYKDKSGKETLYVSSKGTFDLTAIDRKKMTVEGTLKGIEVKEMNKVGQLVGDAITIPEMELKADMLTEKEFEKAHKDIMGD